MGSGFNIAMLSGIAEEENVDCRYTLPLHAFACRRECCQDFQTGIMEHRHESKDGEMQIKTREERVMTLKLSLKKAKERAVELMHEGYH